MTKIVKFRPAGAFGAIGPKNCHSKETANQLQPACMELVSLAYRVASNRAAPYAGLQRLGKYMAPLSVDSQLIVGYYAGQDLLVPTHAEVRLSDFKPPITITPGTTVGTVVHTVAVPQHAPLQPTITVIIMLCARFCATDSNTTRPHFFDSHHIIE